VCRDGQVALFDDAFDAGACWQVISTTGDPRALLDAADAAFLDRLGAVFAHVGPGGNAQDVDGEYAAYFAQRGLAVVVNRPDFYVYGAARAPHELARLIAELRAQVTGERVVALGS
jgi:hypothetical protein